MNTKSKERLQFDFSTEALKRLDDIKDKTDASTRAETVREALRLYEWLVNEVDPDYTIKVYDKSNKLLTAFKAKLLFK
jgi:metal-responsive CopG/Arc/MetJ family transcriptional regulator